MAMLSDAEQTELPSVRRPVVVRKHCPLPPCDQLAPARLRWLLHQRGRMSRRGDAQTHMSPLVILHQTPVDRAGRSFIKESSTPCFSGRPESALPFQRLPISSMLTSLSGMRALGPTNTC